MLEDDLREFLHSSVKTKAERNTMQALPKRVSALRVCADIPGLSTEQFLKDKRDEVDLEEAKLRRVTGAA